MIYYKNKLETKDEKSWFELGKVTMEKTWLKKYQKSLGRTAP